MSARAWLSVTTSDRDRSVIERAWLSQIASDPTSRAAWMAQRPHDRIIHTGAPRWAYSGRGNRRTRRPAAKGGTA